MTAVDLTAVLPLLLIAGTAVILMLAIAVKRSHPFTISASLVGLAAAFASLWVASTRLPRRVTVLLTMDHYAIFYIGLMTAACFVVVLLSYGYFKAREVYPEELYVLLLLATLGSSILAASSHFSSFFLGLEILSVSLYALNSYLCNRRLPLEAGVKYLILGASSSAFLLFGMALIYANAGTMEFGRALALGGNARGGPMLLSGIALIITGIGFKLAVVPFHMWAPDIYQGAPAPVTAFVASVSKGGMYALVFRFFYVSGAHDLRLLSLVFSVIAITSMIAGNVLALLQVNVKRILAYSSIAHMGYILVAFQAGGAMGAEAATFYLVAYFITIIGAFGIVTVLSGSMRDADRLADFRGLFWQRPVLSAIFTIMLLSLAGIPMTAGFLAKFYVLSVGASSAIWALVFILVTTSGIGLYYYLRIVVMLYSRLPEDAERAPLQPFVVSPFSGVALLALVILLVWFGVYPGPLLNLIRTSVASLA